MSLTSYTKLDHVYYTIAWSILEDGKRVWHRDPTMSKTPQAAFEETRNAIQYSKREDFKMKLMGFRFQ